MRKSQKKNISESKMVQKSDAVAILITVAFVSIVFAWPLMYMTSRLQGHSRSYVLVIYNNKCQPSRKAREQLQDIPWLTWLNLQYIPLFGVPSCDAKFSQELFATKKRITAGTQSASLQASFLSFLKKEFKFFGETPHFCVIVDGVVKETCTGFPCAWYR